MPDVEEDLELIVQILDEHVGASYADLCVATEESKFAARPMPREKTGTARLMKGWDDFYNYAFRAVGSTELDEKPVLEDGEVVGDASGSDSGANDDSSSDDDTDFGTLMAKRGQNWTKYNPARRGEAHDDKVERCRTLMTRTAERVLDKRREARRRQLHADAAAAGVVAEPRKGGGDSTDEKEFEVKSILQKWNNAGTIGYLTHWKGYNKSEASWEPGRNLEHAKSQVTAFDKSHK
jgi:hypothetical protein